MSTSRALLVLGMLVSFGCETKPTPSSSSTSSSGSSGEGGTAGQGGAGGTSGTGGTAGMGGHGAGSCGDGLLMTLVDPAATPELTIVNEPGSPMGIFDPSMVYPSGAPGGAMSYSSVTAKDAIRTRIAVSQNAGATWTWVADANQVEPTTLSSTDMNVCPGGTCSGNLINEVSSLIIDPDEPDASRRWKLFTHRYLVTTAQSLERRYGYIALYTAPKPDGPWIGPENAIGWDSETPLSSMGAGTNVTQIPALADCLAMSEPGALWVPGVGIDLALGCVYFKNGISIRIERLRSTDHGKTFKHLAKLLDADDAACLGISASRINAAELFFTGGKEYLIATPETESEGYRGCYVFPIDDPISGLVSRDAQGKPVVVRKIDNPDKRFSGACSYAEGAPGYLVPIAFLNEPPKLFRTFRTNIMAP